MLSFSPSREPRSPTSWPSCISSRIHSEVVKKYVILEEKARQRREGWAKTEQMHRWISPRNIVGSSNHFSLFKILFRLEFLNCFNCEKYWVCRRNNYLTYLCIGQSIIDTGTVAMWLRRTTPAIAVPLSSHRNRDILPFRMEPAVFWLFFTLREIVSVFWTQWASAQRRERERERERWCARAPRRGENSCPGW